MGHVLKRDGLMFCNNRWAGERGSLFVKHGPPTCTWWTTHEGPADPTFPVSAPLVAFGNFWGNNSENSPLPVKLSDIEVLKASLSVTLPTNLCLAAQMKTKQGGAALPAGQGHMFRVYWQLYFSDTPAGAKYNQGDFAPTVFAANCSPTWWASDAGRCELDGKKWKVCDAKTSSGMGRYIIPLLEPYLTPDADGKIEIKDVDLKAMLDWCIAKGFYQPDHYLVFCSAGWEIWILDQDMRMNDIAFTIQQKGKPAVTIPAWTKLMGVQTGR